MYTGYESGGDGDAGSVRRKPGLERCVDRTTGFWRLKLIDSFDCGFLDLERLLFIIIIVTHAKGESPRPGLSIVLWV